MASHDEAQDLRVFIREMTLRIEHALRTFAAEMRADRREIRAEIRQHGDEIRQQRDESRRYFEVLDAKLQDQLEESRAQRQALFRILDRLDNGGAAPAA